MNSANILLLSTPRLVLRSLCVCDVEALHRIHHEAGVWKYFNGSPPKNKLSRKRLRQAESECP